MAMGYDHEENTGDIAAIHMEAIDKYMEDTGETWKTCIWETWETLKTQD